MKFADGATIRHICSRKPMENSTDYLETWYSEVLGVADYESVVKFTIFADGATIRRMRRRNGISDGKSVELP